MQKSPEHLSVQAIQRLCLLMGAFGDHPGLMWLVVYCQELKTAFKNENLLLISVGLGILHPGKTKKKKFTLPVCILYGLHFMLLFLFLYLYDSASEVRKEIG